MKPILARVTVGMLCVSTLMAAHAGELLYGAGYTAERSDNITQATSGNEVQDTIHTVYAGLSFRENIPEYQALVIGRAERLHYAENTYTDETLYEASASVLWNILPQRLIWVLDERYTELAQDVTLPESPTNRIGSNVLETGPDFYTYFTRTDALVLGARYGDVYFDDSDEDNQRYGAHVRYLHYSSALTVWSLNFEALKVEFENDEAYDNFLRKVAYFRFDTRSPTTLLTLDVGATTIDLERGEDVNGPLARFTWTRLLTSESNVGLLLSHELTDAGSLILSTITSASTPQDMPNFSTDIGVITGDILAVTRGELFYNKRGGSFGFQGTVFGRKYVYQSVNEDSRLERGGNMELSYLPTSTLTTSLFGEATDINYYNLPYQDRDYEYGLRFSYRMGRNLSAMLDFERTYRESTDPAREYVENRVLLGLAYGIVPTPGRNVRE